MLSDDDDGIWALGEEREKECPFEGEGGGGDADSVRRGRVDEVDDMELGMKVLLVVVVRGEEGGDDGGDEMSSETGDVSGEVASLGESGESRTRAASGGLLAMVSETCL